MNKRVFIHTNHRQWIGALVSAYSMRRNSAHADEFEIDFIHTKDHPFLWAKEGQEFLRGGVSRVWRMEDLQSFTPLRFMPPQLMGYEGRAIVVDPDVFAVGDVWELLTRDMEGKGVMGRRRSARGDRQLDVATSVMLMDCARLEHWDCAADFDALFRFERDYKVWMSLQYESPDNIGFFGPEWNDFDHLSERTKLLHNTKRKTQPWKTGLPVDYTPADKFKEYPPLAYAMKLRARIFGEYGLLGRYAAHPDSSQERLFFGLLRECLDQGIIEEGLLREEMKRNHVRHDALKVIERTPPLAGPQHAAVS
ncbi:MAG TPA: hypothetical protein VFV80_04900 [Geminicoccaceae bacterium]|nr:hypothetical protein [Geminicoccaceae bacterium]